MKSFVKIFGQIATVATLTWEGGAVRSTKVRTLRGGPLDHNDKPGKNGQE